MCNSACPYMRGDFESDRASTLIRTGSRNLGPGFDVQTSVTILLRYGLIYRQRASNEMK
jgi:hypothetical protein